MGIDADGDENSKLITNHKTDSKWLIRNWYAFQWHIQFILFDSKWKYVQYYCIRSESLNFVTLEITLKYLGEKKYAKKNTQTDFSFSLFVEVPKNISSSSSVDVGDDDFIFLVYILYK